MKLIYINALRDKIGGAARSTVYELMARDEDPLPRPIAINPRRNTWIESEIDGWISRLAEKRATSSGAPQAQRAEA